MEQVDQPEAQWNPLIRLGFAVLRRLRGLAVRTLKLTAVVGAMTAILLVLDTVLLRDTTVER